MGTKVFGNLLFMRNFLFFFKYFLRIGHMEHLCPMKQDFDLTKQVIAVETNKGKENGNPNPNKRFWQPKNKNILPKTSKP